MDLPSRRCKRSPAQRLSVVTGVRLPASRLCSHASGNAAFRTERREIVFANRSARIDLESPTAKERREHDGPFHQREVKADAHARPGAERKEDRLRTRCFAFRKPAIGIERVRIRIRLWPSMLRPCAHERECFGRKQLTTNRHGLEAPAREQHDRWIEAHRLFEDTRTERELGRVPFGDWRTAERIRFTTYLVGATFTGMIIYPVFGRYAGANSLKLS